jgi:hypothetical protein
MRDRHPWEGPWVNKIVDKGGRFMVKRIAFWLVKKMFKLKGVAKKS